MITVSVPCPCGATLLLHHTTCPSCKTPVSPELREALEERLESSHPDYREAKERVRRTAMALLVLAILHAVIGLFLYAVSTRSDLVPAHRLESQGEVFTLAANLAVGAVFFACYRAAARAPLAALSAALAFWVAVRLAIIVSAPAELLLSFTSFSGITTLFVRIVVLVALARGVLGALRLRALVAEVKRDPA
jgi:hypothetical protein